MSDNLVISVLGEPVEVLVSSKSTNYTACACVQTSPPGGGPPPHMHLREEEIFTVLEGEFDILDQDHWIRLRAGETHCSIRGHWHAFRNAGTTPGRIQFVTNGGGLDEYFTDISTLTVPQDVDRLNEISRHYGYIIQPPPALQPS